MEADERPLKVRKLKHHEEDAHIQAIDPVFAPEHIINDYEQSSHCEEIAGKDDRRLVTDSSSDVGTSGEDRGPLPVLSSVPSQPDLQQSSPPLSKNQLKKQRRREAWEAGREFRKAKRRHKLAEKKARKREGRGQAPELEKVSAANVVKDAVKPSHSRQPVTLPVAFIIDCSFDDLMIEKERISLGSQLTRSYSDNYKAPFQAHLIISSWGGLLKQRFDTVLDRHYENWRKVNFVEGHIDEAVKLAKVLMHGNQGGKMAGIFNGEVKRMPDAAVWKAGHVTPEPESCDLMRDNGGSGSTNVAMEPEIEVTNRQADDTFIVDPDAIHHGRLEPHMRETTSSTDVESMSPGLGEGEVVYLTSDSSNTLTTLKPYSTYIIGGLVDKNRHKGICYKTACDRGIKTAKLPIGDYMQMQSRFVLATNHVVEIMVNYLECGNWGEAFMKVIPKRKGGQLKGNTTSPPANEAPQNEQGFGQNGAEQESQAHEADEVLECTANPASD